jgi:hypothetical protein
MERFHNGKAVAIRKRRQALACEMLKEHRNWNKQDPFDCGRTGCRQCHPVPKGHPRRRAA